MNLEATTSDSQSGPPARRRGFSLVEILLSIFILGIGMIMVASIFPVGANWTRQATEETIGQTIAQNALSVIEQYYVGGPCSGDIASGSASNTVLNNTVDTPFRLQTMPGFIKIPTRLRAYQFGNTNPFPAPNPMACTYFWTAVCRLNPAHRVGPITSSNHEFAGSYKYDIYILVFRKGDVNHTFSQGPTEAAGKPFALMRDFGAFDATNFPFRPENYIPRIDLMPFQGGTYNANATPAVVNAVPPVGMIGIGDTSGTVFRMGFDPNSGRGVPRPLLLGQQQPTDTPQESVLYAPGPDGVSGAAIGNTNFSSSPLIYVYQTTLTL